MHLREGEQVIKIFRHHPTPFVYLILKTIGVTFPFFLLLYVFQGSLSGKNYYILLAAIFVLFTLIIAYVSVVYWLDKLVITNERIVFINWKYLTVRNESEAFLNDIQDIQSHENGLFSYFWIFDYGYIIIETASAHTTIEFLQAPDPEAIRQFIYHVKPQ